VSKKPRVLVVEDDEGIQEVLGAMLPQFDLVFATSEREAFEKLDADQFDAVLLDLELPRKPKQLVKSRDVGINVLKQIRANAVVQRGGRMPLPVVVVTARGSEQLSSDMYSEHAANDYVKKPFSKDDLARRLDRAISGKGNIVVAGTMQGGTLRLALDPASDDVQIEGALYTGEDARLIRCLIAQFVADRDAGCDPKQYSGRRGRVLADELGLESEEIVKARFNRLRTKMQKDLSKPGNNVARHDVVKNVGRRGYFLNPMRVIVVDWEVLVDV
jgi:CheY-like chemotaxis protein